MAATLILMALQWEARKLLDTEDMSTRPRWVTAGPELLRTGATPHLSGINKNYVRLAEHSPYLRMAVLAIEDRHFYDHRGIDWWRTGRVSLDFAVYGMKPRGTSTLTQQLARTLYLSPQRTLRRKVREAVLAMEMERRWTKDAIFERYLNVVPMGMGTAGYMRGVNAAAREHFGKTVRELTLAEASLIAGSIQSPGRLNPRKYPERARVRRNAVLQAMWRNGMISAAELAGAMKAPLGLVEFGGSNAVAPDFPDGGIMRDVRPVASIVRSRRTAG
ncbi:MAG: transglycosylase domain-containing protein [Bryobacterales bacterium]|nr:transglycosylase domain-containing protein [Bryobacterales bacterium]